MPCDACVAPEMIPSVKSIADSVPLGMAGEKNSSRRWYTHSYNRPAFYRLIIAGAPYFPRAWRLALARSIAPVFQHLMPKEHAAVQRNLARILLNTEVAAVEQVVRALFCNFATVFADLLSLNRQALPILQRTVSGVHGQEYLHAALAAPGGFIAATAHMGNWDLAGKLLSAYGRTVHVLVAPEQAVALHRLLHGHGNAAGLRFVTNNGAGVFVQLLMALRRGEVVAVQADRVMGHRSDMWLPFFGTPAGFPSGPFVLAAAAKVPVLPCFCLLRPDRQYDIFVEAPIGVVRGHEHAAVRCMVQVLERYVAMAPDQWFNFYDVWDNVSVA
jgi:lauroyl/myristoyl acyltransferase